MAMVPCWGSFPQERPVFRDTVARSAEADNVGTGGRNEVRAGEESTVSPERLTASG